MSKRMSDRELERLLRSARGDFKHTREGYVTHPDGPRWRVGMPKLDRAIAELARPKVTVPPLGPIARGGKSVLAYVPTHLTSGVDWTPRGDGVGFYVAFDAQFGLGGAPVLAIEALEVTRSSSAEGGEAFYATGASGIWWWYGHLDRTHRRGVTFRKGQVVGLVKHGPGQPPGGPHSHLGADVSPLGLPPLLYGGQRKRTDRPRNYRAGSPTIGVQLTRGLAP